MSLKKVSEILKMADNAGYAVPAFNVFNYESISWLIEAAREEQSPVIAMLYPASSKYIPISTFAAITRDLAEKVDIPVGLHFDHSSSFKGVMGGIKNGFPSVMIDGSSLEYEENISLTTKVVETSHALDVDVEAELGFVGSASRTEDFQNENYYTEPERAKDFIDKTGVDALAVAIGSAHGNYVSTPDLDLSRLEKINKTVDLPLVLHGGSGIPESQIKKAVKRGINKVNIGTELNQIFYRKFRDIVKEEGKKGSMQGSLSHLKEDIKLYYKNKIRLLQG
ncbi:MAG: class II fructose-bisphosphate aldolase [bacterium]